MAKRSVKVRRKHAEPAQDILDAAGPPVRVRDVARWAGFSKDKVLDDARRGNIQVVWRRCGERLWAFVERDEARRYLDVMTGALR